MQEVFEDSYKERILFEIGQIYPYYLLGNTKKKHIVGEDSGIMVLSKYDIKFDKEVMLEGMKFPDRFSNRSILYFTIGEYHFATSHLQANNNQVSKKHLYDLVNYSPFTEYIILGDLNHPKANEIVNISKNNEINTYSEYILDYILPMNINTINLDVKVLPINITNVTDHQPIISSLKDLKNKNNKSREIITKEEISKKIK